MCNQYVLRGGSCATPGCIFDRPIVISSHPKRDGSSVACGWPRTHERHLAARHFTRPDCFADGGVTRTPQSTKVTAVQAVLLRPRLAIVRADHRIGRVLPAARPATHQPAVR